MHILTLVVSFTYSIPRFHWPHVMVELLEVTVNRRNSQATVLFRDQLYDAGLMIAFMDHVSRWRHVLSDVRHYIGGYRAQDPAPESWNEECDSSAALLDHRRLWGNVMQEFLLLHIPSPLEPTFVHLHRGPISRSSLRHRRRTSLPLRIALARKLTARHVRRCLLEAFNQS